MQGMPVMSFQLRNKRPALLIFAAQTILLQPDSVHSDLTLRRPVSRFVEAYTKDNATHLAREGLPKSFNNLRLAYLAGPNGAVRLLHAPPQTKVSRNALFQENAVARPRRVWRRLRRTLSKTHARRHQMFGGKLRTELTEGVQRLPTAVLCLACRRTARRPYLERN